jgi:2-methylcitrate dehydratase
MERREFLARSATAVSASLLLGSVRSDGYCFVGSALAAGEGDLQKATLEQKFAEFALSIKYEALPADVIASAKRVLLDTLGCAFGSVGSEPANNDAISFIERGFHPLCAASYGIPLIAGKIWGLPKEALANAVGISAARGFTSFVVNSGAISMMKAMGLAATAADGVFATRLAAQGFTGPSGTLEWLASKMKPVKEGFAVDLELARYRLPRVAFKRFPIQIELQAVAEAGASLSGKIKGRAQDIRVITVESYPGIIERVADPAKFKPQTKGTADHSLPVCLAMALLDGDVTVAQFEKDRWRSRDVMALVEKTSAKPGEVLIAKLPKGRGASIEIVFADGQSLRETVEVPEGDAERPLSRSSLERKFMNFAVPVVSKVGAERVVSLVDGLEELKDVRELTRALRGTGKQNPA